MKVTNTSVRETIQQVNELLEKDKKISPALKAAVKLLIFIVEVLANKFSLNSRNSSIPPSKDPNNKKGNDDNKLKKKKRKQGGQPGHKGAQLKKVDNPDEIKNIDIDRRTLPKGNYTTDGFEVRQVLDLIISKKVIEYRAEILVDEQGRRFVAEFPEGVSRPIQYGHKVKSLATYMSQFQLIPYQRIQDFFMDKIGVRISTGTLNNILKDAYNRLEEFDKISKDKLANSERANADETGININGTLTWLHVICNDNWTHFYPHAKRGHEAMDDIGIIPRFKGVLCHDHWKSYYKYTQCEHALCNAHLLRELEWSDSVDKQKWAKKMSKLLTTINNKIIESEEGCLLQEKCKYYEKRYLKIIKEAEKECPKPPPPPPAKKGEKKKRGKQKQSKSRNLLERFIDFQTDILRFMYDKDVPFTNNLGENDLRMTKVQQKISGCFRSIDGAKIFCRIRGYLITCRKHGIGATDALEMIFEGKLPAFVYN